MSVNQTVNEIKEIVIKLKEFCHSEEDTFLLGLAAQIQRNYIEKERNQIISDAFCVNSVNSPVALEAIAMVLGYKKNCDTIVDALKMKS